MSLDIFNDAFKSLSILNENLFDTSTLGVTKLHSFMDDDFEEDTVDIIDPDASTDEELSDSYIGKIIVDCNVCHSHIFKNRDELDIDESGLVNGEDMCPYCGEQEGFVIIGQIEAFNDSEEGEDDDSAEEDEIEDDTSIEEVPEEDDDEMEESFRHSGVSSLKESSNSYIYSKDDIYARLDSALSSGETVKLPVNPMNSPIKYIDRWAKERKYKVVKLNAANADDLVVNGNISGELKNVLTKRCILVIEDYNRAPQSSVPMLNKLITTHTIEGVGKINTIKFVVITKDVMKSSTNKSEVGVAKKPAKTQEPVKESFEGEDLAAKVLSYLDRLESSGELEEDLTSKTKLGKDERYVAGDDKDYLIASKLNFSPFSGQVVYRAYKNGVHQGTIDKDSKEPYDEEAIELWQKHQFTESVDLIERYYDDELGSGWTRDTQYYSGDAKQSDRGVIKPYQKPAGYSGSQSDWKRKSQDSQEMNRDLRRNAWESLEKEDDDILTEGDDYWRDRPYYDQSQKDKGVIKPYQKPANYKGSQSDWERECRDSRDTNKQLRRNAWESLEKEDDAEIITEAMSNVKVETDDNVVTVNSDDSGKVTVTTEPLTETTPEGEGEMISPLSDADMNSILDSDGDVPAENDDLFADVDAVDTDADDASTDEPLEDEEVDIEMEEVDEESLDNLGESYLKKVYENVDSYKTSSSYMRGDKIIVEGVIKFTSGKEKKTGFILEAKSADNRGRVTFSGYNTHLTNDKSAYLFEGMVSDKKLTFNKLSYRYALNENLISGRVYRR